MKTLRHILMLSAAALAIATLQADGGKKAAADCCDPAGCSAAKAGKRTKVAVTGSMIPVDAREAGRTSSRASGTVVVLTSADLQRIGARDLADALRRGVPLAH